MGSHSIIAWACVALVAVFVSTVLQGCGPIKPIQDAFCKKEFEFIYGHCNTMSFNWKSHVEVKRLETQEAVCKGLTHQFDLEYNRTHNSTTIEQNSTSRLEFRIFSQYKCATINAEERAANLTIIANKKAEECRANFTKTIGENCSNQGIFSTALAFNSVFNFSHSASWYHHIDLNASQRFAFVSQSIANVENYTDEMLKGNMHLFIKTICQAASVDFTERLEHKMGDLTDKACNFAHEYSACQNYSSSSSSSSSSSFSSSFSSSSSSASSSSSKSASKNHSLAIGACIEYKAHCEARSRMEEQKLLAEIEKNQTENCTMYIEDNIDAGISLESFHKLSVEFFQKASVDLEWKFNHTLEAQLGVVANSTHAQLVANMHTVDNLFELPLGLSSKLAPQGLNLGLIGAGVCAMAAVFFLVVNRYRKSSQTPRELIIGGDDFVENGLLAE